MGGRFYSESEIETLVRSLAGAEIVTIATCPRRLVRYSHVIEELGCSRAHVRNLARRGWLELVELETGVGAPMRFITYDSYRNYLDSARPVHSQEKNQ